MVNLPRSPLRTFAPRSATARYVLALLCASTVILLGAPALLELGATEPFHPHGYCYLWKPALVGLHLVSDLLIGFAYVSISATLLYLIYRARPHIPFSWIFLAFGTFIVACGATHLMEVWTLWNPTYWLAGGVKLVTAVASVATAAVLPPLVPRVVTMVEASEISEQRRQELEVAHRELTALYEEMKQARDVLQQEVASQNHDVGALAAELGQRKRELEATLEGRKQVEQALREANEERSKLLEGEKSARREAEAANRSKDQFLAVVSHELRTPLTAMLGWARLLRSGNLDAPTRERALDSIERNTKSQAQLIEDLLDVSRIISGKLRLDIRSVDLVSVIEAALDAVRPAADAKGIRLQPLLDPKLEPIVGDAERLQQVVWNLLSNAIKFTPRGGRVQVRLALAGSQVEVTVSDTGAGIEPSFLPHIFERFRQADTTSTRTHGGLGLGLSIVSHLVELHGGTVSADSAGEGNGATFTVKLPLGAASASSDGIQPHASNGTSFEGRGQLAGLKVLVVDDDPDTLAMLGMVLRQCGADVRAVLSAAEALAALRESQPDVLISDIGMPGEDGYALIRSVRALEGPLREIPALALTAYARVEDRLKVLSAGFQMHVPKPIEPEELVAVVSSLALLRA
jgi:signal transduction histidine kinase